MRTLSFKPGYEWEQTRDQIGVAADETCLTDDELRLKMELVAEYAHEAGEDQLTACRAEAKRLARWLYSETPDAHADFDSISSIESEEAQ